MNKKIIVNKTRIIITDYNIGDSEKLENNFLIFDKTYHTFFPKGMEYDEEKKWLYLPRGIDIIYLENIFGCRAFFEDDADPYDSIEQPRLKYMPRDDVQREALEFMNGESLKYRANRYKSQLSVNLNTGKGKTYISVATIAYMAKKAAIITSSTGWLDQWNKCIQEYTDIKANEIYYVTGSASIRKLEKYGTDKYKIFLISTSTLKSFGDKYGWDQVENFFKILRIGVKIYDECHLHFDTMCKIDYHSNTFKTFYVTATLLRSSEEENRVFQLYFKNIPKIDLFNEEEDPHTRYLAIKYNSKPTAQEISNCRNQYGLDRNKYTNYLIEKENYYSILNIVLSMALRLGGKTLIYIGTQHAIDCTYDYLVQTFPSLRGKIGIYTSKTNGNKANQLNKQIILSTTKSCGAAVDIKDLKCTIVLAEPFKSEVLARQTLGRTRNDDTWYIEVVDTGFLYTNKYFYEKKHVFEKYATQCDEVTINKYELISKSLEAINTINAHFFTQGLIFGYTEKRSALSFISNTYIKGVIFNA